MSTTQTPSIADVLSRCLVELFKVVSEQIEAERHRADGVGPELDAPGWLTRKQAAAHIAVSLSTFAEQRKEKGFPKPKTIGGRPKWSRKALDAYMASLPDGD